MEIGQLVVVQPEKSQKRDVEVLHGMNHLDGLVADLVRGSNRVTCPYTAPGHHDHHGIGIVIPSHGDARLLVSYVDQGRFAHLTEEDMQYFQDKVDESWEKWWLPGVIPVFSEDKTKA